MKTNRAARRLARIRVTMHCLAIAGVAAVEFLVGHFLVARMGQTTVLQAEGQQALNVGIADLMLAAR